MKKIVYVVISGFLFLSCNQNKTATEKEYIKNLEEKNRILKEELDGLKGGNQQSSSSQGEQQKLNKRNDYFTIGSTEEDVLSVMGDPTSLMDVGSTKIYIYGSSRVVFEEGKVNSYNNSDGNLKIRVKKRTKSNVEVEYIDNNVGGRRKDG